MLLGPLDVPTQYVFVTPAQYQSGTRFDCGNNLIVGDPSMCPPPSMPVAPSPTMDVLTMLARSPITWIVGGVAVLGAVALLLRKKTP